ncbi:MAG TPA: hypothetical protein PKY82_28900 [Pyrinomonadaceae bacterium]|nr:hypothetical protein [Pyrinomonadaceae bacterium]
MKKNLTNLIVILTAGILMFAGCKLPKIGGGTTNPTNSPKTTPSLPPTTKMPSSKLIVWELANKTSTAAILYGLTGNESTDSLPKAKTLAQEVGGDIPPFPPRKGDKIKDTVEILGYLLNDFGKKFGSKIKDKYGDTEAALFETSLKANTLLLIYVADDSTSLAVAKVIRDRAKIGGLPENLWMPVVDKIESGEPFDEVKEAIFKMQTDVSRYLNQ